MEIKQLTGFRDGGSVLIETDTKKYWFDYGIGSPTKGTFFTNGLEISSEERSNLLEALNQYSDEHGYKEQLISFLIKKL